MTDSFFRLMEKYRKGHQAVFCMGPFLCIDMMRRNRLSFDDILKDPKAMAAAALMNFDLGFDATVLPFDINVEAEILGATVRYHEGFDGIPVYPTISEKIVFSPKDVIIPEHISQKGRLPAICQCLQIIKATAADRGAVGVSLPGPFTLAGQVMDMDDMFIMVLKDPDTMEAIFQRLSELIQVLRNIYVDAGVDFIVIEEGGATTISPRAFQKLLLPHLKRILSEKAIPHALSLTGGSDKFIELMLACGPDAIGVDQECSLQNVRHIVPAPVPLLAVCGAYDLLARETPEKIRSTVNACMDMGITAAMPPADIYPPAKPENITAFITAVRQYHRHA